MKIILNYYYYYYMWINILYSRTSILIDGTGDFHNSEELLVDLLQVENIENLTKLFKDQ